MQVTPKPTLFYLALITLTATLMSGCKTFFIKPTDENDPTKTTSVEIKETPKIVYVEVDPTASPYAEFCTSQCSKDEINAQLNMLLAKPIPSQVYSWMEKIKRTEPQNLKEQLDDINANHAENSNSLLLNGIFLSLPKTGHRDTSLAIKHLSDYAQITENNIYETTFLSLVLNTLKDRKALIDERSKLREEYTLLEKQNQQQQIQTLKLKEQLNKIKEIEHLMYKRQSQSQQYKVQE